jgi:DNA-binding winged helix-turn-helix (wHTH) protein
LEILIALLERRGELVNKQDLMVRVWPNAFIESANVTVHMSTLRRALRDGQDGNRD